MRIGNKALTLLMAATIAVPAISFVTPTAIKVQAENVYRPEDFGAKAGDGIGDRQAIKDAVEAAAQNGGGIIEFGPGQYDIDILNFSGTGIGVYVDKPNITFRLQASTVLNVLPTAFGEFCAIHVKGDNFKISGGKIIGDRSGHKGSDDADGHGIGVTDCSHVEITNMTIQDNWGDGIYLGSAADDGSYPGSSDVKITHCTIKNNRRNNIAIVDADHVTIDNCNISNASGASPCSGIQIEPNTDEGKVPGKAVCSSIVIKNSTIKAKKKHQKNGKYFALNILNPYYQTNNKVVAKNVKITNCKIKGDMGNYSGKKVVLKKTTVTGTFYDHKNTSCKKCKVKKHYKF